MRKSVFSQRTSLYDFISNPEKVNVQNELEYDLLLSQLKFEFEYRYQNSEASLETGLDGFTRLGTIGKGSFGKVDLIEDHNGHTYAAKIIKKEQCIITKKVEKVINEKRLLDAFRFPFIIYLNTSRKDHENLYLIMPALLGGDLFTMHLRRRKLSESNARFYAAQVCLGLEYLHYMRIVYRDLKLENILLDNQGYLKLADFGSSKYVESHTMSLCGTPEYMAPELLLGTPYFTGPDWWAFGVLVYELINGATPFICPISDKLCLYTNISEAHYSMPKRFTVHLKNLIKNFLKVDYTERLGCRFGGVDEVKKHPWFSSVDWFAYLRKEITPPYIPEVRKDPAKHFLKDVVAKSVRKRPQNIGGELFAEF